MAAREISLRDYLAGHVLRSAMLHFEQAVGPWVKVKVLAHFGASADEDSLAQEHAARVAGLKKETADLESEQATLKKELKRCPAADKQRVVKRQAEVKSALAKLRDAPQDVAPIPLWIQQIHVFLGPAMKAHVSAESRWDVHTIAVIMQALLPDVFAPDLPSDFHAKRLLSEIVSVQAARTSRAHGAMLTEPEVLHALLNLHTVLQQTLPGDPATARVGQLLNEAKRWVALAQASPSTVERVKLGPEDANAQQLCSALAVWERHVEATLGLIRVTPNGVWCRAGEAKLEYRDKTVTFGFELPEQWRRPVRELVPQWRVIALARHWYFHHLVGVCDFAVVFTAMDQVLQSLRSHAGVGESEPHPSLPAWNPPFVAADDANIMVRLNKPSVQLRVPIPQAGKVVVGRDEVIEAIVRQVLPTGRVLVHGTPGVGKDTVMAAVAEHPALKKFGGIQIWLQASKDEVFRRQLIDFFGTHHPEVVKDAADVKAAVKAIAGWLAENPEWLLFVEDANAESTTLWEVLPPAGRGGTVIISSQEPLHEQPAHREFARAAHHLAPFTTSQSLELLQHSSIFGGKAPPPPERETEEDLATRCKKAGAPHCYTPPPPGEKAALKKKRRRAIEVALFQHAELSAPELAKFLEETLGNLPLSVALFAHNLRADPALRGARDLIEAYRRIRDPTVLDRAGRNPQLDRHFLGLKLSVQVAVQRLRKSRLVPEDHDRRSAEDLLVALAMLDRTALRRELLLKSRNPPSSHQMLLRMMLPLEHDVAIFRDSETLDRAEELCCGTGLIQEAPEGSDTIGPMHQRVQWALRYLLVAAPDGEGEPGRRVAHQLRTAICGNFFYTQGAVGLREKCRRLAPSAQAWCDVVLGDGRDEAVAEFPAVAADVNCLQMWGVFFLDAEGDPVTSERALKRVLTYLRRTAPDSISLGVAMGVHAITVARQGRYEESLALDYETLEVRRRMQPPNPSLIATTLNNIGENLCLLGRKSEAIPLLREALDIRERYTPDDPAVGHSLSYLGRMYSGSEALEYQLRALQHFARVWPADHEDKATLMTDLGSAFCTMGRHFDGLRTLLDALAMFRRVLGKSHYFIGKALNLIGICFVESFDLPQAALPYYTDAWKIWRESHPETHPDVITSKMNVYLCHNLCRICVPQGVPPTSADEDSNFQSGDLVLLRGLIQSPSLNGLLAIVLPQSMWSSERVTVLVDTKPPTLKRLKEANITPPSTDTLPPLVPELERPIQAPAAERPDSNPAIPSSTLADGTMRSSGESAETIPRNSGDVGSFHDRNTIQRAAECQQQGEQRLCAGVNVTLTGLLTSKDLNGLQGTILPEIEWTEERVAVRLHVDPPRRVSLQPRNLIVDSNQESSLQRSTTGKFSKGKKPVTLSAGLTLATDENETGLQNSNLKSARNTTREDTAASTQAVASPEQGQRVACSETLMCEKKSGSVDSASTVKVSRVTADVSEASLCLARLALFEQTGWFYAFGNTPPEYVFPGIAQDAATAEVLLLASGDLRSPLYSLTRDARLSARVRFTVNDQDVRIVARNVLLLWLAHASTSDVVFSVWFSIGLAATANRALHDAFGTLCGPGGGDALTSIGVQFASPHDRDRVVQTWREWSTAALQLSEVQTMRTRTLVKQFKVSKRDIPDVFAGFLAGVLKSPEWQPCPDAAHFAEEAKAYGKTGNIQPQDAPDAVMVAVNPTLVTIRDRWDLHYGSFPFSAFPLCIADLSSHHPTLTDMCHSELKKWLEALERRRSDGGVAWTFIIGDCVRLCATLIPRLFDVVCTSNVADYVGLLPLLQAGRMVTRPGGLMITTTLLFLTYAEDVKDYLRQNLGLDPELWPGVLGWRCLGHEGDLAPTSSDIEVQRPDIDALQRRMMNSPDLQKHRGEARLLWAPAPLSNLPLSLNEQTDELVRLCRLHHGRGVGGRIVVPAVATNDGMNRHHIHTLFPVLCSALDAVSRLAEKDDAEICDLLAFGRGEMQLVEVAIDVPRATFLDPQPHPVLSLRTREHGTLRYSALWMDSSGETPVLKLLIDPEKLEGAVATLMSLRVEIGPAFLRKGQMVSSFPPKLLRWLCSLRGDLTIAGAVPSRHEEKDCWRVSFDLQREWWTAIDSGGIARAVGRDGGLAVVVSVKGTQLHKEFTFPSPTVGTKVRVQLSRRRRQLTLIVPKAKFDFYDRAPSTLWLDDVDEWWPCRPSDMSMVTLSGMMMSAEDKFKSRSRHPSELSPLTALKDTTILLFRCQDDVAIQLCNYDRTECLGLIVHHGLRCNHRDGHVAADISIRFGPLTERTAPFFQHLWDNHPRRLILCSEAEIDLFRKFVRLFASRAKDMSTWSRPPTRGALPAEQQPLFVRVLFPPLLCHMGDIKKEIDEMRPHLDDGVTLSQLPVNMIRRAKEEGAVLFKQSEFDEAAAAFQRAIAWHLCDWTPPDTRDYDILVSQCFLNLAACLLKLMATLGALTSKQTEHARDVIQCCDEGLKLIPSGNFGLTSKAHYRKGCALEALGDANGAAVAFEAALEAAPKSPDIMDAYRRTRGSTQ